MTDAPGAIGSSDLSLREWFPGLLLCAPPPPPISKLGTEIAIPLGADLELLMGDTGGVAFGVFVLGDFDPKFQNEDFFPGEEETSTLFLSRRCNTFGDGGPILFVGELSWKVLASEVLFVGASDVESIDDELDCRDDVGRPCLILPESWRQNCVIPSGGYSFIIPFNGD